MTAEPEEIEVNANGGKQSRLGERWDLLPQPALQAIAACMHRGTEKYGERNYHKISVSSNLNHAIRHAFLFIESGNEEDIINAATRMLFALELHFRGDPGAEPKA
jgi:hypothetical protein